jgi:exosortase C (VPDSG-CTERM-specific)
MEGGKRFLGFLVFIAVMTAAFSRPLLSLAASAAHSDLNSYILLIPFVSGYLLFLQRKSFQAGYGSSPAWACLPAAVGLACLAATWNWRPVLSQNDSLSLMTLAFVSSIIVGALLFMGRKWLAGAAFPMGFLIFMMPIPDAAVESLETASKLASAEVAAVFFDVFGVPALRGGVVFQLPDITIRVAQECSGIHSSLVLVIASLLASHLILRTFWRRALLIVFAISLGVIRNGFRILVLGWLCVHIGPQMIDSPIHHKGGPVFFVLSLIPFFLLLWALCRADRKALAKKGFGDVAAAPLAASDLQPE